jgi:hypothetical protein
MMKRNDNGSFCVLYVEAGDDRAALFQVIAGQKKPVVIMLAEQARIFQRPEDFAALKHVKRQLDLPIVFVIPASGHLTQLASRNGFPVYLSMDALSDALIAGQLGRHRSLSRAPMPDENGRPFSPKKTVPLSGEDQPLLPKKTTPLEGIEPAPVLSRLAYEEEERALPSGGVAPTPVAMRGSASALRKTEPLRGRVNTLSSQKITPFPSSVPSTPPGKAAQSIFPKALALLAIFALAIAGIGSFLVFYNKLPDMDALPPPKLAGRIAFLSSGQLSENSSQGINDEVVVNLTNVPSPAPQKRYYAWLLGDKNQSDTRSLLLGSLTVSGGKANLLYDGDQKHANLLLLTSRFLVTEEDAAIAPIAPSPDYSTWRYYGEIPQIPINTPDNTKHYSFLDHLRHLLASDPAFDQIGLAGGLNNWLYRNTSKVLEWTTSMREPWEDSRDVGFVRRQTIRVLDYLDGASFVQRDLPPNTPLLVNERLARVGLLEVTGPTQDPPGYLTHIVHHLNGLLQTPENSPERRKMVAAIVSAMNNAKYWLSQLREDARKIVKMSDEQLRQPATLTLINNMIDNATHAYGGEADPAGGSRREGVNWVHEHMQLLAAFDISTYTASSQSIQMVQDIKHLKGLQNQRGIGG